MTIVHPNWCELSHPTCEVRHSERSRRRSRGICFE